MEKHFFIEFLCSINRYAIENTFDQNYLESYASNTEEPGYYLGTPMKEADLLDSLYV